MDASPMQLTQNVEFPVELNPMNWFLDFFKCIVYCWITKYHQNLININFLNCNFRRKKSANATGIVNQTITKVHTRKTNRKV